jgi:hypothetical protein
MQCLQLADLHRVIVEAILDLHLFHQELPIDIFFYLEASLSENEKLFEIFKFSKRLDLVSMR